MVMLRWLTDGVKLSSQSCLQTPRLGRSKTSRVSPSKETNRPVHGTAVNVNLNTKAALVATGPSAKDLVKLNLADQNDALHDSHRSPANERRLKATHTLRTILREASYLPDPVLREWIRQHAVFRFRATAVDLGNTQEHAMFEERASRRLGDAQRYVNQLIRANQGDRKILMRVCLLAYGRIGKRRHDLMKPLLYVGGQREIIGPTSNDEQTPSMETASTDPQLASHMSEGGHLNDSKLVSRQPHVPPHTTSPSARPPSAKEVNQGAQHPAVPPLTPQMEAMLRSQIQAPLVRLTRPGLRRIHTALPEVNAWLRPMPAVRVKNMVKQRYAELLEKVHPPLPTAEWEHLRDLAIGAKPVELIARRKPVGRGSSDRALLEMAVQYGKPNASSLFPTRQERRATARFVRRLWQEVFEQCPRMDWKMETQKWEVTWGAQALRRQLIARPH